MKPVITEIARKIGLKNILVITYDGVSELEKNLPAKLRNWHHADARFLVLRDNDDGDCHERKKHLNQIVSKAGKGQKTTIRIVCQELEAWFLGDRKALDRAGIFDIAENPAAIRGNVDDIVKPSRLLDRHSKGFGKLIGAERIAPHLDLERNSSPSFRHTVQALRKLAEP